MKFYLNLESIPALEKMMRTTQYTCYTSIKLYYESLY